MLRLNFHMQTRNGVCTPDRKFVFPSRTETLNELKEKKSAEAAALLVYLFHYCFSRNHYAEAVLRGRESRADVHLFTFRSVRSFSGRFSETIFLLLFSLLRFASLPCMLTRSSRADGVADFYRCASLLPAAIAVFERFASFFSRFAHLGDYVIRLFTSEPQL